MKRYAVKFMRLPAMPAHSYLKPQILPKGAAMLVTNEIIAKIKNIVMMAIVRPLEPCLACVIMVCS